MQIRALRPALEGLSLRLIHSGRLLTDGILLLPWLRQLEDRIKRQAAGMGGELENMLKEVGLAEGDTTASDGSAKEGEMPGGGKGKGKAASSSPSAAKFPEEAKVYLHCNVGPRIDVKEDEPKKEEEAVSHISSSLHSYVEPEREYSYRWLTVAACCATATGF